MKQQNTATQKLTKQTIEYHLKECDYYINPTTRKLGIGRWKLKNLIQEFNIIAPKRNGVPKKYKYQYKPMLNIYYKMKNRCYNKTNKDYEYYGGRGITVDEEWLHNRDAFYEYCIKLPNAFEPKYSIDRINNNGNYEPGNIRFVSHKKQCNNRRSNKIYKYKGENKTIAELADKYNLEWNFVRDRLKLGWTIKEAIELPKWSRRDSYKRNTSK